MLSQGDHSGNVRGHQVVALTPWTVELGKSDEYRESHLEVWVCGCGQPARTQLETAGGSRCTGLGGAARAHSANTVATAGRAMFRDTVLTP